MGTKLDLLLMGLSHRTASIEVREDCSLNATEVRSRLEAVRAVRGVQEAWLISTCNRTELLVALSPDDADAGGDVEPALRELVLDPAPVEAVYTYRSVEAVMQLFRVASGLDSLILGESQIMAQVKEALNHAREAATTGVLLEPLLQQAIATGKRVRNQTAVGRGTLSVARAGVEVAAHVFGSFEDTSTLIIGAGETGRLAAANLREFGAERITFLNRSVDRAREAASALGGKAAPLDELADHLHDVDLVFACVEGAPGLLGPEKLPKRRLSRRDRPLVLVDLSVPRAVAPEVAQVRNVLCYDLDDLARIVESNRHERNRASEEAAPILLAEVHKFLSLRTYASYSPTIARLRSRFEEVREEELDSCAGDKSSADMAKLAHRLSRHLLDVALEELKASAREAVPTESLDRAYQRFLENQ